MHDDERRAAPATPVRVASANDYDLIVAGLANLLEGFPDDIQLCERIIVGQPIRNGPIDIVLYDTYGRTGATADAIRTLIADDAVRNVVVFTLDLTPELVGDAKAAGATGIVSKSLGATTIRDSLLRVAGGEVVVAIGDHEAPVLADLSWPGKTEGLSERESQVLVLVAEGLTNKEIATVLFLSVETVKTHLRQILSKLGLRNRVEATAYVYRTGTFSRLGPPDPADAERPAPGT